MKRALITGITGQDGAYLAEFLLRKGYHVTGTSRTPGAEWAWRLRELGIIDALQIEPLEPTSVEQLEALLQRLQPTELYHLAGLSSVARSLETPLVALSSIAGSVFALLEATRRVSAHTRIFVAGSGLVFGDTQGALANEASPLKPSSPYAAAKAAAMHAVTAYRSSFGLFACTGILYNHESPLRGEEFVTRKVIRQALELSCGRSHQLTLGDVSVVRDWGYAPEYVEGMWHMLQQTAPQDFVLATGHSASLRDFIELTFELLGIASPALGIAEGLIRRGEVREMRVDPGLAREKLGWQAKTTLKDLVSLMLNAEKARG